MKKIIACFFIIFSIFSGLSAQSSREVIEFDQNPNAKYRLFRTTNTYNFIMLDTFTGATYQVQWSFEERYRFIIPISGKKE